jgi:putative acetyltransferase
MLRTATNVIRDERPDDAAAIRAVLEVAFSQAVEADLVDRLRQTSQERLSLVALSDDRLVGHILFTPVTIETHEGPLVGCGLGPMAVLPEFQRTGIGSALVRAGTERLCRSGCPFVVVVGHSTYYPRFGFVPASKHGIRCQWNGVPDEAFMVHVLQPSIAARLAGLAKYRPEFDEAL